LTGGGLPNRLHKHKVETAPCRPIYTDRSATTAERETGDPQSRNSGLSLRGRTIGPEKIHAFNVGEAAQFAEIHDDGLFGVDIQRGAGLENHVRARLTLVWLVTAARTQSGDFGEH